MSVSPVYRDLALDARDRYRGTSFANYAGHLEQDRRVLAEPSVGAWLWNPDKAFGVFRLSELNNRPLYPVHLAFVWALPALTAYHWITVFHVTLKALGLVLLTLELGWPFWLAVAASAGAMLAEGSLRQFGDFAFLPSGAWFVTQAWLTVRAARHDGWTAWDSAWVLCATLRVLGSNATYVIYYELLLLFILVRFTWGRFRAQWAKLALRYAAAGLLLAPLWLPLSAHYFEAVRAHFAEFTDWHLKRAYNFRNYWLTFRSLREWIVTPSVVWLATVVAIVVGRGRTGPLTQALGAFALFGVLYSVRYSPVWYLGSVVPGIRIPEWIFEPLPWLIVLALADVLSLHLAGRRRLLFCVIFGVGLASAAWQTSADPRTGYIWPRWTRELPHGLAAAVKAEGRSAVLPITGPDRAADDRAPLLNSNHHHFLGLPAAHYLGEMASYHYARATYRVPGLLFLQRAATPLWEWDTVVDVYAELGVGWVFWDGAGDPTHPRLRFVGEEHGFRLYRIEGARPPVFALDRVRRVASPGSAPEVAALVFSLPALGPFCYGCREGASRVEDVRLTWVWGPGDVIVDVESPAGTLVVLGETRSRGWQATVDDRPVQIYAVNELFQAVAVPAGRHRVRWRFASFGFFVGLGLAALGLVGLVAVPAVRRVRIGGAPA